MKRFLCIIYLVAYVFLTLLTAWIASELFLRYTTEKLKTETATKLYEQASAVSSVYGNSYYDNPLTRDSMRSNLTFLENYSASTIWILDTNGNVLISSNPQEQSALPFAINDFDPTDTGRKNYMIGDYYGYFDEKQLTVLSTIVSDFEIRGYVVIHTPVKQISALAASLMMPRYIPMLLALGLSLLALLLFFLLLLKPFRQIDLKAKTASQTKDIERNMIANISHDFRSPLTSIKGYAEAMVDGTIPSEASEKYLNIIISETERLHQLTENLLTLNRYDTMKMELELSAFDMNQILKDTGALFEGRCLNKKISLRLVLSGKTLMVCGDEGKIKQVIYNLVDNAIKFSHPSSVIILETSERNEKALISVKDSGIGIPKDSLPHIWERFYKTDSSRGKDKQGFGLGLSIIQKILQAHGETIEVASTEGIGTRFTFTLPKAPRQERK